jgi:putative hemolysin
MRVLSSCSILLAGVVAVATATVSETSTSTSTSAQGANKQQQQGIRARARLRSRHTNTNTRVLLANPASTNCIDNGGSEENRYGMDGGEWTVCTFSDGSACEEWSYLHGQCNNGQYMAFETDCQENNGAYQGHRIFGGFQGYDTSRFYHTCQYQHGSVCFEEDYYQGKCSSSHMNMNSGRDLMNSGRDSYGYGYGYQSDSGRDSNSDRYGYGGYGYQSDSGRDSNGGYGYQSDSGRDSNSDGYGYGYQSDSGRDSNSDGYGYRYNTDSEFGHR